ncbi:MAG: acyl-CoA dehydrogenase family protein [Deltaproteobacteria bacterium]|nr:acyl-CoA dehydrogenase family protein [Deltaproteobacteria bacterium]
MVNIKGETSFAKSLFHGFIPEEMVFPYPQLSGEEDEVVRTVIESFRKFAAKEIDSRKIDHEKKIPQQVLKGMAELGLTGLTIPEKYGGFGFSQTAYCRIFEALGSVDGSCAVTLGAHMSIGLKGILLFGTEAQKKKYLPPLARDGKWAAFALTEPTAGSDARSIKTKAVESKDGSHFILNGSKIWITNGGFADVFTVFAMTDEPDGKGGIKERMTAFIVTRDMEGFSSGPNEEKLGINGSSTAALYFNNIKVPKENLLGERGKGFKVAVEVLNSGRLGLGAGCLGASKKMIEEAVRHATERKQFNRPICEFGIIQEKIGRMTVLTYALESMVYLTTGLVDAGVPDFSIESAICKVYGSEICWEVVNEALQISGGSGYMKDYPYERYLRDSRINLVFEGTNEILRIFIALAGMQEPGDYLAKIGKAMKDPIKSIGLLSDFAVKKIKKSFGTARITLAHSALKREAVLVEDFVSELAFNVEKVLRRHGAKIVEKELAQERIADMAILIYAMISVISRTSALIEKDGEAKREWEITAAKTFCQMAKEKIEDIVRAFDNNVDEPLKELAKMSCGEGKYLF